MAPQNRKLVVVFILLAALFFAGLTLAPKSMVDAISKRYSSFQNLKSDKPYVIRQLMIKKGWYLFQESPVIGIGPSRWRSESIPLELPDILRYAPQEYFDSKSSHNSYISFLAENGLIAALPFVALLIVLVFRGIKSSIFLARQQKYWAIGAYAGFTAMSVHMWALAGLTGTSTWVMYGLVGAITVQAREKLVALAHDQTNGAEKGIVRSQKPHIN